MVRISSISDKIMIIFVKCVHQSHVIKVKCENCCLCQILSRRRDYFLLKGRRYTEPSLGNVSCWCLGLGIAWFYLTCDCSGCLWGPTNIPLHNNSPDWQQTTTENDAERPQSFLQQVRKFLNGKEAKREGGHCFWARAAMCYGSRPGQRRVKPRCYRAQNASPVLCGTEI